MTKDMRINRVLFGIIMTVALALASAKVIVGHTIRSQDRALTAEQERGGAQPLSGVNAGGR
jgi:hypothetical protein